MTPAEIRDLVERLEFLSADNVVPDHDYIRAADKAMKSAATALTELLARCEGLEEALRPFAQLADAFERAQPGLHDDFLASSRMSSLRKARAALSGGGVMMLASAVNGD